MLAQVIEFPGWDGFLGTRASLMMDLVVVAMVLLLAILVWGVQLARQGRFVLHSRVQTALAAVLFAAVAAFEIDIRINGWRDRAAGQIGGAPETMVLIVLWVHLFFAVTTFLLWPTVVFLAKSKFSKPPAPGDHSATHRRWARLAAWDLAATTVTGWVFYYVAFVR